MENQNNTQKHIKDLKKKIRKKARIYTKSRVSKKNTASLSRDLKKNDMSDIYSYLDEAERNARVGLNVPEFSRLFILKRITYRWVLKFLFKILKVVTINQSQFNLSILDALIARRSADTSLWKSSIATNRDGSMASKQTP